MATYRVPVLGDFSWQPSVKDKDLADAPGAPSKGDRYIVASGTTSGDDWFGHTNDIAWYDGSTWQFDAPSEGWQCWVDDEDQFYYYNGTSWQTYAAGEMDAISAEADLASSQAVIANAKATQASSQIVLNDADIASLQSDTSSQAVQITSLENSTSSQAVQLASAQKEGVYVPEYGAIEFTI